MDEPKYLECLHCKKFYSCEKKDNKPQYCLNFEERRKDGREKNVCESNSVK